MTRAGRGESAAGREASCRQVDNNNQVTTSLSIHTSVPFVCQASGESRCAVVRCCRQFVMCCDTGGRGEGEFDRGMISGETARP